MVRKIVPKITANVSAKALKNNKKDNRKQIKAANVRIEKITIKIVAGPNKIDGTRQIDDKLNKGKPANRLNPDEANRFKDSEMITAAGQNKSVKPIVVRQKTDEINKIVGQNNSVKPTVVRRKTDGINKIVGQNNSVSKKDRSKIVVAQIGAIKPIRKDVMKPNRDVEPMSVAGQIEMMIAEQIDEMMIAEQIEMMIAEQIDEMMIAEQIEMMIAGREIVSKIEIANTPGIIAINRDAFKENV